MMIGGSTIGHTIGRHLSGWLGLALASNQSHIRLMADDLPRQLKNWLDDQEVVLGCVAWLNRQDFLKALNQKRVSCVVMQKEENFKIYRRHDPAAPPSYLGNLYLVKNDVVNQNGRDRYRLHNPDGKHDRKRSVMHHKFLVGCGLEGPKDQPIEFSKTHIVLPQRVWYGSWNMTNGSHNNCDSALTVEDPVLAERLLEVWFDLWNQSESIETAVFND